MEYSDNKPLGNIQGHIVYVLAFVGVAALGVVSFGWGVNYNPILTPFAVMVIGASLLVYVLSNWTQATFVRVFTGVIGLVLITLYLVNWLRVMGPTESDTQLIGAIAGVFLWTPMSLGVLAGYVSSDRYPTLTIGDFPISSPHRAIFVLGLLTQFTAIVLLEEFVLADPPAFAGVVYTMITMVAAIAWAASVPFYLSGRNL